MGPTIMACGLLDVEANGLGLGPYAFGSLAVELGTAANFLFLLPFLTVARLNW